MEKPIEVRAETEAQAANIAQAIANLLSSGTETYTGVVLEQTGDNLFKILVRGGQEDDRETEAICRELSC